LGFFVKLGKLTGEDVRIEEIRVADDALTAAVNLSIRIGGEWKRMDPQTWARVEGEWYITFDR
jgi:hypothetical protein